MPCGMCHNVIDPRAITVKVRVCVVDPRAMTVKVRVHVIYPNSVTVKAKIIHYFIGCFNYVHNELNLRSSFVW